MFFTVKILNTVHLICNYSEKIRMEVENLNYVNQHLNDRISLGLILYAVHLPLLCVLF